MTTVTLRQQKLSPLTNQEIDDNFSNLNTNKLESVVYPNLTTSGSGWYRVATTNSDGRGTYDLEVYTTGGNHDPSVLKIVAQCNWTGGRVLYAIWDGVFPASSVRVTRSASNSYLEVYFTTSVNTFAVRVNHTGFASGIVGYSGALSSGGDTVAETLALSSRLNISPGYIAGINSSTVTNALGYTPYRAVTVEGAATAPANGLDAALQGWTAFDGYGTAVPNYPNNQWWVGAWTGGNSTRGVQLAGGYADSELYFRKGQDGWQSWKRIWHAGNLTNLNQLTNGPGYITGYTETDTLATVTARGTSTSTSVQLTSAGNHYNGHFYYDAYAADGSHYPHFLDGGNASGSKINWRLFTGATNSHTHYWGTDTALFATKLESTSRVDAPIFYDRDNNAYYIDPGSTSNLWALKLNRNTDHQLQVARIRGLNTDLTGDYIHMYERVHIGYPSGWGGIDAPSYGLSTWGQIQWSRNTSEYGVLSTDSGWGGTANYPTIGSAGVGRSLIMLHNPHMPYRTDNPRPGASGRAGIRMAVDAAASGWWDCGLTGDAFEIYRGISNTQQFWIDSSGHTYARGSFRAPIFYDTDTSYYLDPDSTSKVVHHIIGGHSGTAYNTASTGRLYFGTSADNSYSIYTHIEDYGGNYTKLTLDWHTGIKIGAAYNYGGIRFYNNSINSSGSEVFSIAKGDNHIRINNNLYISGVLYDSDTSYYLDPNSSSFLNSVSVNVGNESTGAGNSSTSGLVFRGNYNSNSWAHKFHKYDNGGGVPLYLSYTYGSGSWSALQGWGAGLGYTTHVFGNIGVDSAIYTPTYYRKDNTGYYLDPSSGGTALNIAGNIVQGNGGSDTGLAIYHGGGSGDYGRIRFYQAGSNNQVIHVFSTAWQGGSLQSSSAGAINLSGANGITLGPWNTITSTGHWFDNSGNGQSSGSFRSPIFYDSNDTSYYLDPNSTSRLYRVDAKNLAGAILNVDTSNIGIATGYNEATTWIDGSTIQAHVSTAQSHNGCYMWYHSEFVEVNPEKDYEFSYWVKSNGQNNVYFGWHEIDASGNTISLNPYFTGSTVNTNGTWQKRVALLRSWRTPSPWGDISGTDRYATTTSRNTTGTDGVMHSNTRKVQLRFGTCYGDGSQPHKTYFYLASIREVTGHDRQQQSLTFPYYNGSSYSGSFNIRTNTHWDSVSGIDLIGASGEFRMSSDSGSLTLRVDGGVIAYETSYFPLINDTADSAYYLDLNSTSRLYNVFVANQLRSPNFYDTGGNFIFQPGTTSGTTRHLNLANTTGDPAGVSNGDAVGITWGQRTDNNPYYLIYPYYYANGYSTHTRLRLAWHTGIEIGASSGYGGTRFFDNSPFNGSEIFSVGKGDSHVRVNNNLYISGVLYDSNDNGYYVDPNGTNRLNFVNSNNHYIQPGYMLYSDHGSWQGEYNKIQWHSSHLYLQNNGGGYLLILRRGDGGERFYCDYNGNVTASGNITAYSDQRLKTNIETIANPLELVNKLRGVTFDWIETGKHSYGLIAQEVEQVIPELVLETTNGNTETDISTTVKSVDYSKLVSVLIEAVKEQQQQIDKLTKLVETLLAK